MRKSRHRRDPRRHRALSFRRNGGRRARPARRGYAPPHGMRGGVQVFRTDCGPRPTAEMRIALKADKAM